MHGVGDGWYQVVFVVNILEVGVVVVLSFGDEGELMTIFSVAERGRLYLNSCRLNRWSLG